MAYFDSGELKAKCSRLQSLLEKDREEAPRAVEGDILQVYQELLDLEIGKTREIRRWLDTLFW